MSRGGIISILILLMYLLALPLVADEVTEDIKDFVIETFDTPDGSGENSSQWLVRGSKFTVEGYPQKAYANEWPEALFRSKPEGEDIRCLGVHGKFTRQGYNSIELIPIKKVQGGDGKEKAELNPIEIPGRVKSIDVWAWGSNYHYWLEIKLRDYKGFVHTLKMGDLDYIGWKNLTVEIPDYIDQAVSYAPKLKGLELIKLVLWTRPFEKVEDFFVYFDHIKVVTDMFEAPFDGEDLANPERVKEIWSGE